MGFVKDPVAALDKAWQHHRREVRRLHEKLFYRPLLDGGRADPRRRGPALARGRRRSGSPRSATLDPKAALRHLEALTSGRHADRQHPAHAAAGDARVVRRRPRPRRRAVRLPPDQRVAAARRPWYLKTLRDEGQVAERLARLLATSRYATDLLEREPQGVRMLGEDLAPLSAEALTDEMLAAARRQDDPEKAVRAIRAIRRRELFRIAAGDLLGLDRRRRRGRRAVPADRRDAGGHPRTSPGRRRAAARGRCRGADADGDRGDGPLRRLRAVLRQRRRRAVRARPGAGRRPAGRVVVRHGGGQRAPPAARAARRATRRSRSTPTCAPRASRGRWCARSASYAAYYAKWSKVWEAQALLRADAVVGDLEAAARGSRS